MARLIAAYRKRTTKLPIFVNSVKGHLGHSLGAAGAMEAVYSALAAQNGISIGNHNLERPISLVEVAGVLEHVFDKETAKLTAQTLFENISFDASHEFAKSAGNQVCRRLVLTNSFGFGGTNASLLLSNWIE